QAELCEVLRPDQQIVGHLEVLPDATEVAHVERDAWDDLALHADRKLPVGRTMAPAGRQILVIQIDWADGAERQIRDRPADIRTEAVLLWIQQIALRNEVAVAIGPRPVHRLCEGRHWVR